MLNCFCFQNVAILCLCDVYILCSSRAYPVSAFWLLLFDDCAILWSGENQEKKLQEIMIEESSGSDVEKETQKKLILLGVC